MTDTVTLTLPDEVKKYADSAWAAIAEHARAKGYEWIAQSIEEQVKPAIEEPTEFGSIVRARHPTDPDGVAAELWQMSPTHGQHYWQSESEQLAVWSELRGPEVLRVGIGEQPLAAWELNLLDGQALRGIEDVVARGIRVLEGFRDQAITAERKDAYQNAINVLREIK
jgi:hypothetical protein